MKKILSAVILTISCLFAACSNMTANAQSASPSSECSRPLILKLIPTNSSGIKYELSGNAYTGYPLDELRRLISGCKVSRTLYVVVDSRIPIGQITNAVAPKLQADNVRYFIQYPESEHMIVEIKVGEYLSKLP